MLQKTEVHVGSARGIMHAHPYPQILLPMESPANIWLDDVKYRLIPEQLCLIPKGVRHRCDSTEELLILNLADDLAERQSIRACTSPVIVSMPELLRPLAELMQAELWQDPDSPMLSYLVRYLCSKLLSHYGPQSIQYINRNFNRPITVAQLAEIERYNVTYYNNWFKQQTGCCPGQYLRNVRMDNAKEMLETTQHSIQDIAERAGYCSSSTFIRAFHQTTGMTPLEYRAYGTPVLRAARGGQR